MNLNFNLPINSVSFGQTSILILRTLFDRIKADDKFRGLQPYVFPIGQVDLSAQKQDKEFEQWLNGCIAKAFTHYKREMPIFKLWHLNGSMESYSQKQNLLSFYELDAPTPIELNIARNNKISFSSKYTCEIFKQHGVDAGYIPLAFDSYNFKKIDKKYFQDDRVVFNLTSKFEKRKGHEKVIKSWIKKYGNNPKYALQCAIFNPFLTQQQNNQIISQLVLEGNPKPFNVSFLPTVPQNEIYNDFLNSGDIIIGMGNESWGLPEFHSVAMGKHSVILDYNGHSDWADSGNSVLVSPDGKEEAYDGMFFHKGQAFNQGKNPTFSQDSFISGCEIAVKRVLSNRLNSSGLALQEKFSKELFLDNILATLGS